MDNLEAQSEGSGNRQLPSPDASAINSNRQDVSESADAVLGLTKDQVTLAAMREKGVLDRHDFDLNFFEQLVGENFPLTRSELGKQALVLSREDAMRLIAFPIKLPNGDVTIIEGESIKDPVLVIFPHDLGD